MLGLASPGKVSELCRQYQVHPSLFYRWKKQFLEGGRRYLSYNVSTQERAGVKRRHLTKEAWEALIKAVEELKAPLKPLLDELGVSQSSYYRRRREYLQGGVSHRRRGSGRRRRFTVEA